MTPFLAISELVVEYDLAPPVFSFGGSKRLRAVDGVSLEIPRGEVLALVGESGCGKSTLGRASIALERIRSGRVEIDGVNLASLSAGALRRARRRMQIVFQDPLSSLNPRLRIGDQIAEGIRIHNLLPEPRVEARVGELLERVGLAAADAPKYPHEFSGGQRQRIAVARALAVEPEYIVLDEPVSALDVSIRAQILSLLWDLKKERNLTYLFITHDLALAFSLAERIAVMYLGRIAEEGPAAALLARPRHPYTATLLSAIADADPDAARADVPRGDPPSPVAPPPGCAFHPRCSRAEDPCRAGGPPPLHAVAPDHATACLLEP